MGFAGRQTLADAVSALTLPVWQRYFEQVFLAREHALQVVSPGRWGILPAGDYRVYDGAKAIQRSHTAYLID